MRALITIVVLFGLLAIGRLPALLAKRAATSEKSAASTTANEPPESVRAPQKQAPRQSFTVPATSTAPISATGIWMSRAEILNLPTRGSGWNNLLLTAMRPCGVPDLSNQDDPTNVCVLAKALVYARTGESEYADAVREALRSLVNAPKYYGRALSLGRELAAYVIASDVIDLKRTDPMLDALWRMKIQELRGTFTHSGPKNLVECHELRPNNWGNHCGASRVAIDLYLDDRADLQRAAKVFKGYLGDRSSYAGFKYGALDWQCDPAAPVGINPKGCTRDGHSLDGVLPDDQRRAGGYTWPPPKENYVWEALQGATLQAMLLERAGYDAFNWSDKALLRAVEWLHRDCSYPAKGDDTWIPYVINAAYGTKFPTQEWTQAGKNFGWTDWARPSRREADRAKK